MQVRLSQLKINKVKAMKSTLIAAATLVAAAHATPALAQAVIDNPGMCEQFYPNANCEDMGPGNPYTGSGYRTNWHSEARWPHYREMRNR